MKRLVALSLTLVFAFTISCAPKAPEDKAPEDKGMQTLEGEGEMQTIEGTVVCLLPDYGKGNVKPVISVGGCDGLPPHGHILVTKQGAVYSLQQLSAGLMKIEKMTERENVKITGRVMGGPSGYILFVN